MQFHDLRAFFAASLMLITAPIGAKQCNPSGLFFRSHGDQLKVEPVQSGDQSSIASFSLIVLGNVVQDAPTIGRADGQMALTQDQCLGVYSDGNSCTLVFEFSSAKLARLRQIGDCSFGAGANAEGTFYKTTKPERYLP
jgi:hypothetical protein